MITQLPAASAILGDLPFYVAPRGADRPGPSRRCSDPTRSPGSPPDAFTADGQLWGNPTYDWAAMRADGFRWWIERLRRSHELFDSLRIDHFRAFVAWWGVPRGARTARSGTWRRGPGAAVIDAARAQLGALSLVAEDLGVITPQVRALIARLGLPGMRVIQFAFEGSRSNAHRLENHVRHAVVYSGTHDNQTAAGWWQTAPEATREEATAAAAAAGIAGEPPHRLIVRLALSSPAGLAIVPVQDLLGLGDEARLNTPGTRRGNWSWRLRSDQLTTEDAAWLREVTEAAGRLCGPSSVSPPGDAGSSGA